MTNPMSSSAMMVASVLKHLGHPVPASDKLQDAIKEALKEVKVSQGLDPDKVKIKTAVPIDVKWIKEF